MPGPLQGVRVLDLSRILAGPWAAQVLADFGADVIKVEKPGAGDDTRSWGPPWLKDRDGTDTQESAYYLSANRNKQSIAIDLSQARGQTLVRELIVHCDVLIENYRVGGLARYGLDYAAASALCPRLVYCSITGFGQSGPYAQRAGYDAAIQAQGGLMSLTGEPDDAPGAGPQKVGVAVSDLMAGMYAVAAILAALRHRDLTGVGQHVDLALLDTQVGWLANQAMNYLIGGTPPARQGTAHPNIVPYQVLPSSDGHFMLAVGNDAQFARCCAVIGRPELIEDSRYRSNSARVGHRLQLIEVLSEALRQNPTSYWLKALEAAGVPVAPVNRLDQVFADPQIVARGLRFELPHPLSSAVPMVANPVKFSATPCEYRSAPPLLGQHSRVVLRERLGLSESEIEELFVQGVVADGEPASAAPASARAIKTDVD